jgi:DNA ligase 1
MEELGRFIEEMRATSSATDKVAIIKRSSAFIHNVLEATYNPYKQYHVTSKTCIKNNDLCGSGMSLDLFELLDKLNTREVTGHDAIKLVNRFASNYPRTSSELIYNIIDKDLKIRTGAKVINKAFPGLIPEFNVALAQNYEPKLASFGEDAMETWYASRKLDGVRCLAVVDIEGNCRLYSRMGKEFTTLSKVKQAIEATGVINTVFDGEICILDKDGNEDFQSVMKEIRRKDHQIENPSFMVFDMLSGEEFNNKKGSHSLSTRLWRLRTFIESLENKNTLRYLDQAEITDERHFDKWAQMAGDNNWEGFMLRKDVGYEGKRSKNLLKVKTFHDAEYVVVDYDNDMHEVVRDGKSETIEMLAQVWIEHKGHKVKVGSGWSQDQRLQYMDGSIVGQTITVQYFEETKNDKGGISLRFPTVKVVHGSKRDM